MESWVPKQLFKTNCKKLKFI